MYGYTSHIPLGGTYPLPEEAVENNAATIIHFKDGGTEMMIKSWAAEVGHNGNGMVGSKESATLLSRGLRWKTHDMDAAEGSLPWCQTRHLPGFVKRASSTAVLGRLRQRS